jgi:hypothetical protein
MSHANKRTTQIINNENTFAFDKWTSLVPFTPNQLGNNGAHWDEAFDVPPVNCMFMGPMTGRKSLPIVSRTCIRYKVSATGGGDESGQTSLWKSAPSH